ncbi:ThuA domain-containing protein [Haloferula sp. BvORR071]|uniref:ThuA domain-containing protein n=1 Tax=Haloferula sp. BvORR071 TaxID=1396141 RepID=UPI000556E0C3|nr:ThuA domain-containing protein [Haloferula sp. BvORR071]
MKTLLATAALLITALLSVARAEDPPPRFRAVVLAEKDDNHGPFVTAALDWLKTTAAKENFAYDVFEEPKGFNKGLFAKYQLVIQLNYPPYRWSDEAKAAFEDYIENGRGGWVGLHHATLLGEFDGYPMWPWFSDFMGGIRFKSYIAKRASGTVEVEAADHPCFKGLPKTFTIDEEEWYTYDKNPRPKVLVLAKVDEASYKPDSEVKMGDHPVVWSNPKMKARNVYIQMGHHPSLIQNENYTALLRNSILWAATGAEKAAEHSGS